MISINANLLLTYNIPADTVAQNIKEGCKILKWALSTRKTIISPHHRNHLGHREKNQFALCVLSGFCFSNLILLSCVLH